VEGLEFKPSLKPNVSTTVSFQLPTSNQS